MKNSNSINAHIEALKCGACRKDSKNRICYMVPTQKRRNGFIIIPEKTIKRLMLDGKINASDLDKIQSY